MAYDGDYFWINKNEANIKDKAHVSAINSFVKVRRHTTMAPDGLYLWVNKDAATINENAYSSTVNSFVQKEAKTHKQRRVKKFQSSIKSRQLPWRVREGVLTPVPGVTDNDKELNTFSTIATGSEDPGSDYITDQQVCNFPSDSQLDPFLPLAGTVTCRDRNLLHYYLTLMPSAVYGSSKSAPDCIVRDHTVPFVQMNNTWLHWVLLLADRHRLGPAAAETSPRILARKSFLYRNMYEMVTNAETRYSDITITALGFASWAEGRSSSLDRAQNHLLVVKFMVQVRGGLPKLRPAIRDPILYPFIWLGVGAGLFSDVGSLESAIASFLCLMRSMQEWQRQYQQDMQWSSLADAGDSRVSKDGSQRYVQAREHAFGPMAALRPFLQVPFFDLENRIQMRSHMALLWWFNKTLWELRNEPVLSIRLLNEIDRHVTASDETAQCLKTAVTGHLDVAEMQKLGLLKREPTLKASAVVHIFAMCALRAKWPPVIRDQSSARFIRWYETASKVDDEVMPTIVRLFEVVDSIELLQFLSEQKRQKVLGHLSAWLIGDVQTAKPVENSSLSIMELDKMANEMRCAWLEARRSTHAQKL